MRTPFKIDPKTGAIIFQKSPEEKNLQEFLEIASAVNSSLTQLIEQNNVIIEQNNEILHLLSSKGGITVDE